MAEVPTLVDEIILVDDHSRDGTAELARKLGLHTIRHEQNRGYGGNQKTCYRAALENAVPMSWSWFSAITSTRQMVPALAHCVT